MECLSSFIEPAAGTDLGFYKGGCPIHLKGAQEVEHRRRRGGSGLGGGCVLSPENLCISYTKIVSFYAFPEIFIDTVTALTTCFEHVFFHKRTP